MYLAPFPAFDTSSNPLSQWYYFDEQTKKWQSYYELSTYIENYFQKRVQQVESMPESGVIDFEEMVEKIGKTKRKIHRATWFWHDDDMGWYPYTPDVNSALEDEYSKGWRSNSIKVSLIPPRFIRKNEMGHYMQYRITTNGNKDGREVTRGFPGEDKTERRPQAQKNPLESMDRELKEFKNLQQSWREFKSRTTDDPESKESAPEIEDLPMSFEEFCDALSIFGYTYVANDTWNRDNPSVLSTFLWSHFFSVKGGGLDITNFFETITQMTRGEQAVCRKFAYSKFFSIVPDSSKPLKTGLESTITILETTLLSIGLGNRGSRMKRLEEMVLTAIESSLDLQEYQHGSLIESMIQTYFSSTPLPRIRANETLSQLIPFDGGFELAINISLGIQLSTERTIAEDSIRKDVPICKEDCGEERVIALPFVPFVTCSSKSGYKVLREYAPVVFRGLRKYYGITDEMFLSSIGVETFLFKLLFCGEFNTYRTMGSHGKSGSVFFYTYDSQFMIKTIKPREAESLRNSLPIYYKYLTSGKSYLVPFLGLYLVTEPHQKEAEPLYICIMKNLFATPNQADEIFDLKGSTYDRTTKPDARKPGVPLKDKDLGERVMILPKETAVPLLNQIRIDCNFLNNRMSTMDYSFLVGIHKVNEKTVGMNNTGRTGDGGFVSYCKDRIYYFGIIDYLITFDMAKAMEGLVKRALTNDEVSSVAPQTYSDRFVGFLEKKIWFPNNENDSIK